MSELHLELGVIVARRAPRGAWGRVSWTPVAVVATAPHLERGAFIARAEGDELIYAGAMTLSLHASETAHYRDNLLSGRPSIWIAIQSAGPHEAPTICCVTADPYEGEALAEVYGENIDAVSMPEQIIHQIASFIAAHHVDRVFVKRTRT